MRAREVDDSRPGYLGGMVETPAVPSSRPITRSAWVIALASTLLRCWIAPSYGYLGVDGDLIEHKQAVHFALTRGISEVYLPSAANDPALTGRDWAGGFFIKNPKMHNSHPDFLIPATNEIVQEFADLLAVIASAAGDNKIDGSESKVIRKRWEELKSVTETFVACCEQGNFGGIKDVAKPLAAT